MDKVHSSVKRTILSYLAACQPATFHQIVTEVREQCILTEREKECVPLAKCEHGLHNIVALAIGELFADGYLERYDKSDPEAIDLSDIGWKCVGEVFKGKEPAEIDRLLNER